LISPLIGINSDLIQKANYYKQVLALVQGSGFRIPSTMLSSWTQAFVRVLRHCADMKRWELFDTLERRTQECLAFIANANVEMNSVTYATTLNTHFDGITLLVVNEICEAVIHRETDIRLRIAESIPTPDGGGYVTFQQEMTRRIDRLTDTVVEISEQNSRVLHAETDRLIAAMPEGGNKMSIFGAEADRIKQLLENGDPMSDKEIARHYLRGLCDILLDDRELRLNGDHLETRRDAVRYVFGARGKDTDPHAALVGNFFDVTSKHNWRKESTIYQNIKNLGSENLTNRGMAKNVQRERKRALVTEDLEEMTKVDPCSIYR